jgi:Sulfotransferase family
VTGLSEATLSSDGLGSSNRGPDRLVASPVFVLSPMRAGSTLLRMMLNGHSRIHAPQELRLGELHAVAVTDRAKLSLEVSDLDERELEYLLWDRLLHRELARSGKDIIVEKTPANVLIWRRLGDCWPGARFIFLLRHPGNIAASALDFARQESIDVEPAALFGLIARQMQELDAARATLPGVTATYEDLTSYPARVLVELCGHLGVKWEPQVLDYQADAEDDLVHRLGDWGGKIRSGRVQPGRPLPLPQDVPTELRPWIGAWGYDRGSGPARH